MPAAGGVVCASGRWARRSLRANCTAVRSGDVGLAHEAIAHDDLEEACAKPRDFEPLVLRDVRDLLSAHGHQHDLLVQDLIVLDVVHERPRYHFRFAGHVHRCAADPDQPGIEPGDKGRDGGWGPYSLSQSTARPRRQVITR
jgi:hypothetical protein